MKELTETKASQIASLTESEEMTTQKKKKIIIKNRVVSFCHR